MIFVTAQLPPASCVGLLLGCWVKGASDLFSATVNMASLQFNGFSGLLTSDFYRSVAGFMAVVTVIGADKLKPTRRRSATSPRNF